MVGSTTKARFRMKSRANQPPEPTSTAVTPPAIATPLVPCWKRKSTYLKMLAVCGLVHGLLVLYGTAHPPAQMGIQLFVVFTLNVALLGWCYVDAGERVVPIAGLLGFAMLFIPVIGVPWYFFRSRGFAGAFRGALGFGLFGVWFCALLASAVIAGIIQAVCSR